MTILNLDGAPEDPIERLLWLSGVAEQVKKELDHAYGEAYFYARLQRQFDAALNLRLHSRKRVLAFTRAGNEARARLIRWGDGY